MKLSINIVDAFTNEPFKGNSAAVIIHDEVLDEALMQSIAIENNLSETAYVTQGDSAGSFNIRWFSPITEIDFCGHATLAAAFILFRQQPGLEKVSFFAPAVGELTAVKGKNGFIEMNFPSCKPEPVADTDVPADLLAGLSIPPVEVWRNIQAYFAVYEKAMDVHNVIQNSAFVKKLGPRDLVVTALSDSPGVDFVSRYFWPANGGDEDPVTGSIHTGLAPLWGDRLGKQALHGYQASKRGGHLLCRLEGDRVIILGQAVQYLEGTIF